MVCKCEIARSQRIVDRVFILLMTRYMTGRKNEMDV